MEVLPSPRRSTTGGGLAILSSLLTGSVGKTACTVFSGILDDAADVIALELSGTLEVLSRNGIILSTSLIFLLIFFAGGACISPSGVSFLLPFCEGDAFNTPGILLLSLDDGRGMNGGFVCVLLLLFEGGVDNTAAMFSVLLFSLDEVVDRAPWAFSALCSRLA